MKEVRIHNQLPSLLPLITLNHKKKKQKKTIKLLDVKFQRKKKVYKTRLDMHAIRKSRAFSP